MACGAFDMKIGKFSSLHRLQRIDDNLGQCTTLLCVNIKVKDEGGGGKQNKDWPGEFGSERINKYVLVHGISYNQLKVQRSRLRLFIYTIPSQNPRPVESEGPFVLQNVIT